jgi:parvulin-like peptidyl-prolyl isomerase
MKMLYNLLIVALLLLVPACGSDTAQEQVNKSEQAGQQPAVQEDPEDYQVVYRINERQYTNKDFKNFIRIQYSGLADDKPTPRLLSRLFDSFMEQKITAYYANRENVPVDQLEYNDYISKINVPDASDPLDKASVLEAIKVQKYLYHYIYQHIEVTDKEVATHYKSHMDDYRKKREVLLHQILVKDRKTAVEIRGELDNSPHKFAEIAKTKSISMEAENGGLMGYFEEGTLPEDMEKVVFSLKTNSISPVVESSYGFHIFKVTKKKAERLLYQKRVEPEIRNKLMAEKLRNAYENFLAQAKQELKTFINHDALYFNYHFIQGNEVTAGDHE